MADVINLSDRRAGDEYDGQTCPSCAGAWFTVQAASLDRDGGINAYMAPVACHACGHVLVAGPWVPPGLAPIGEGE